MRVFVDVQGLEVGEEGGEFAAAEDVFLVHDGRATAVLQQGDEAKDAAGSEAVLDLRGEVAEEEHGADDEVEGAGREGLGGEVDGACVDGEMLVAGANLDVGDGGGVDGGDVKALIREPEAVATEAGGDVEGASAGGKVRSVGEEERLRVTGVVAGGERFGMAVVPGGSVGHGGRVMGRGPSTGLG